jgi:Protein of unknown function (DUF2934)
MLGGMGTTGQVDKREIEKLAHLIWQQEGRPEGRAAQHWIQAEFIVRSQAPGDEGDSNEFSESKVRSRGLGSL